MRLGRSEVWGMGADGGIHWRLGYNVDLLSW